MAEENLYSLDVYEYHGDRTEKPMVIMVRRRLPFYDEDGIWHRGSQKGIRTWFHRMRYARTGDRGAYVPAETAVSHALFFTQPADWVEKVDYLTDLSLEEANDHRQRLGRWYVTQGFKFVGNENHRLGSYKALGLTRPQVGLALVANLTIPKLKTKIEKMTAYSDVKLTPEQTNVIVTRCISATTNRPIETVSELFDAVCEAVIDNIETEESVTA